MITNKWVQDEKRPEVYCPIRDDMQVVIGLSYITNGSPPGEVIGTFVYDESGVIRITLK